MSKSLNVNEGYKSICLGYSEHSEFPNIYVKHLDSIDLARSGEYYDQCYQKYIHLGAKTKKDILNEKIKDRLWTQDNENKIKSLETNISLMQTKKNNATLESQLDEIENIIQEYSNELTQILNKKYSFFTTSAEHLADTAVIDYIFSICFFKDQELKLPLFSLDDVEHFSEEEMNKYFQLYSETLLLINYKKIREIAIVPKFIRFFKNSNSCESFFGRNGKDLTQNQILLFDTSKYFIKLLENIDDLTEEESSSPEKIERAFIVSRNAPAEPEENNLRSAFAKAKTFNLN